MANHAFISFRGVFAHLDVNMTFTHGVAPSQCQIRIPPTPGIEAGGPLVLNFGGTRITLTDCKVDRVDEARNADGLMVWTLTILDRRWKWKDTGAISGYYNVREGENADASTGIPKQIKKGTEKNARALCKLCLEAMGEKGFDVSRVPDDIFPEVEWDYEVPSQALAKLSDALKMRVVLNWRRDRVELWPDGEGQLLTKAGAMEYQLTIDPPERPDQLIFAGHRMLWEQDLELEAVARDAKGEWHPLNTFDIPYLPKIEPIEGSYFWNFDPEFGNAIFDTPVVGINGIKTYRDLAKADVYRKYRIATPFNVGNEQVKSTALDRVLPLLSTRLHVSKDGKTQPPVLWGLFFRDTAGPQYFSKLTNPRGKLELVNPPKEMTYEGGFQVDEKTGIVSTERPVYQFGKKQGGITVDGKQVDWPFMKPAQLWLRVGFGLRDEETRGWKHKEIVRKLNGQKFGTKPRYITAADAVFRTIRGKDKDYDNAKEYEKIAKHYLDLEERKFEDRNPAAATYMGLVPWSPDGAIQQITWSITESGATTHVNRNREDPWRTLTYDEQRMFQQAIERNAHDPTSRESEDKLKRRPA